MNLEPFLDKIICGDTLKILKKIPSNSIDTIITSPPYWGLRDYGEKTNTVWGGDPNCEHEWGNVETRRPNSPGGKTEFAKKKFAIKGKENFKEFVDYHKRITTSSFCSKCGAWYGQLGLEPTLDMYLGHMLQITKELKRVLKKTGVMFWNHGDSYGGTGKKGNYRDPKYKNGRNSINPPNGSYTPKCMALQNYRLVLRMIDEQGWILRNIIIWHKPNHMPSSVRDRFANAYEPVFMLVKSKKYWFDLDAVRVPSSYNSIKRANREMKNPDKYAKFDGHTRKGEQQHTVKTECYQVNPLGKNPGDVWTIPTQPFPEAHFATFPEKLIEPMIKEGCPKWICKKCGKPRERITKFSDKDMTKELKERAKKGGQRETYRIWLDWKRNNPNKSYADFYNEFKSKKVSKYQEMNWQKGISEKETAWGRDGSFLSMPKLGLETIGWTDCGCNAGWRPGIVLDPFCGSGTTCYVARKLGRHFIGIELNPDYCEMAGKRISKIPERLEKFGITFENR